MPDGSMCHWPSDPSLTAAIAQRADLLAAIWAASRSEPSLRELFPEPFLSALPAPSGEPIDYAVTLAFCPDGVWRAARDHLTPHPGAALLQAPLLAILLPALCRSLLGRSLLLPSMPAWWLADPVTRTILASRPNPFRLRDGLDPVARPKILAALSPGDRIALQAEVDCAPTRWIVELNQELPTCCMPLHRRASSFDAWPRAGAISR